MRTPTMRAARAGVFGLPLPRSTWLSLEQPQPEPSLVLGIFGLSLRTDERRLEEEFGRFGKLEKVTVVYDRRVRAGRPPTGPTRLWYLSRARARGGRKPWRIFLVFSSSVPRPSPTYRPAVRAASAS